MTDTGPKVSVIIPCFNSGDYLREAVDSAVRQSSTELPMEVLVINDHSDDPGTLDALHDINDFEQVRVIDNRGKRGPAAARNLGIAQAKGDWIAFMDADDMFTPNSIAARLAALSTYPDAAWIGGDLAQCDQDARVTEASYFRARPRSLRYLQQSFDSGKPVHFDDTLQVFLDVALVHTISSLIRTSELRATGGFNEALRLQQDLHLFLQLARRLPFVFVPEVVATYRTHASNSTRNYDKTLRWRHAALSMLARDDGFRKNTALKRKLKQVALELSHEHLKQNRRVPALIWRAISVLDLTSSLPGS